MIYLNNPKYYMGDPIDWIRMNRVDVIKNILEINNGIII